MKPFVRAQVVVIDAVVMATVSSSDSVKSITLSSQMTAQAAVVLADTVAAAIGAADTAGVAVAAEVVVAAGAVD